MRTYFYLLILIAWLILSSLSKNQRPRYTEKKKFMPGVIQIEENLFIDQFETTNFNWLEYMYWARMAYGKDSEEYKSIIPKSELWLLEKKCLRYFADYYLMHPSFQNYPVVGISQEQVAGYCKWRTDRVFEFILIAKGEIDVLMPRSKDEIFTIEKYFDTSYFRVVPNREYAYYPKYELPTVKQWDTAFAFTRKMMTEVKRKKMANGNWLQWMHDMKECENDSLNREPLVIVDKWMIKNVPCLMIGNVSEWLKQENTIAGYNWKDSNYSDSLIVRKQQQPSTNTGFRAICRWEQWTN